jgi:hypothetical protein
MMATACFLCVLGALTLSGIVLKLADLSSIAALLLSVVAMFLIAIGLAAKENSKRGTPAYRITKFLSFFAAIFALYPGAAKFPAVWHEAAGFGSKAFLVWLILLAWMLVWVILQAGEEKRDDPPSPTGVG